MSRLDTGIRYGIAVPDLPEWEGQLRKVPVAVLRRLQSLLPLVSENGVRSFNSLAADS